MNGAFSYTKKFKEMIKMLNLKTNSKPQELIKQYLEKNASQELTDKINNGVNIDKDGKILINRKTLDGFMKYATEEARKLAEKGANSACVEDEVVFGWAIHYFEEDSIEEKLFNEDGSPYQKKYTTPTQTNKTSIPQPVSKPKPKPQISIFDMLETQENITETTIEKTPNGDMLVDTETGEIMKDIKKPDDENFSSAKGKNSEILAELFLKFGDNITIL